MIHEERRSLARISISVPDNETGALLENIDLMLFASKPDGTSTQVSFATPAGRPATGTVETTAPGDIKMRLEVARGCQPSQAAYEAVYTISACPGGVLRCSGPPPTILATPPPPPPLSAAPSAPAASEPSPSHPPESAPPPPPAAAEPSEAGQPPSGTSDVAAPPSPAAERAEQVAAPPPPSPDLFPVTVGSARGEVLGGGIFSSGSEATVQVRDRRVPMKGALGRLGGAYEFAGWAGRAEKGPTLTFAVDGPAAIEARWKVDLKLSALLVATAALLALRLWPAPSAWSGLILTRKLLRSAYAAPSWPRE